MYKIIQLHQPARRGLWYIIWTIVIPAFNIQKHYEWKTVILHLLYWLLVRNRWGDPACPLLLYSSWSHLLPCFLFSLVSRLSSCLFRQGARQQQCRLKADSLNARQCFFVFCPCLWVHCLPCRVASATSVHPIACPMAFAAGSRRGCCRGNLRVLSREEKIVQKKKSPKYQLFSLLHLLSLFLRLAIHFSLPFFLNWTHTF